MYSHRKIRRKWVYRDVLIQKNIFIIFCTKMVEKNAKICDAFNE